MDGLVKACMHSLSFYGVVHQGGRSVADCGPVAKEIGSVGGLSVYITLNSGRSAYLPIVIVTFGVRVCPQTLLLLVWPQRLRGRCPLYLVCPLILRSIVGRPSLILYLSEVTMAVISGLWWW